MSEKYLHEKLVDFEKALNKFGELALMDNLNEIERDAAILRFEFTYEMAWKCLKHFLESKGAKETNYPKDVIKTGYSGHLIENELEWIEMIKHRNLTVHTYREEFAISLASKFRTYYNEMTQLLNKLKSQL
jgi:nucleotidyltransferase substrate binding protein (TIGR01987 family)